MRRAAFFTPSLVLRQSLFALATAALVIGCGGGASGTSTGGAKSGTTTATSAQDFSGRDTDGKTVRLSDHLGKKVILLDFWSTYCEPCKAEMPHLRRLYDAYKAKGFVVMGIAMDGPETVAEVPAFAKRNNLNFPVVLDEDSSIASIYNPKKSAPLTVLIDKGGQIKMVHEGYNPGDEEALEKHLKELLDGAAATK